MQPNYKNNDLSSKKQQIKATNSLPLWVINPKVKEGITAVGMAKYSKYGLKVMKPQAKMDALAKLAGKIETKISQNTKRTSSLNKNDNIQNNFSQSTKEVVDKISLSDVVVVNQLITENGDYYVQIVINLSSTIETPK